MHNPLPINDQRSMTNDLKQSLINDHRDNKRTPKTIRAKQVEVTALDIAVRLQGQNYYKFILKAVWNIPPYQLHRMVEDSIHKATKRPPIAYFIACAKAAMGSKPDAKRSTTPN